MKLRNKRTGEIGYTAVLQSKAIVVMDENAIQLGSYTSLAELNEEWCDYEEPKVPCFINWFGEVSELLGHISDREIEKLKEAGNHFETKEEAEKAVEKLKAFKRLKDKGFRFTGYTHKDRGRLDELEIYCQLGECPENIEEMDDVHLLFGGEE